MLHPDPNTAFNAYAHPFPEYRSHNWNFANLNLFITLNMKFLQSYNTSSITHVEDDHSWVAEDQCTLILVFLASILLLPSFATKLLPTDINEVVASFCLLGPL